MPAAPLARLGVVALVALALARWLFPLAARHAPIAVQTAVSFATFRALGELVLVAVVLALARALLGPRWTALGLVLPSRRGAIGAFLAAPVTSVIATYLALALALPVLMDELARRGAGASQANAGAFGRELVATPIVTALLSGALLAAFAEELVFRGALYAFVRHVFAPRADDAAPRSPASSFIASWGPAIVSAAAFGLMHWDLPGGVGIVRIVSTTCLGLATGFARKLSGSIVASAILHATYNVIALGIARGWFARAGGVYYGVPIVVSCAAALVVLGLAITRFRDLARTRAAALE